jgi:hypothetical protein
MSITKTIAPCFVIPPATRRYGNTTEASAAALVVNTSPARNFLPGLRPVQNEVEAYFADAFAGRTN